MRDAFVRALLQDMEADDRVGLVETYLNTLLPENWTSMDLYERRSYLSDHSDPTRPRGVVQRQEVSNVEIWAECFSREPGAIKKTDRGEILSILAKLGWKNGASTTQRTAYGVQKCFSRPGIDAD